MMHENKEELQRIIGDIGNEAVSMLGDQWLKVVIGYFIDCNSISHCQIFCLFYGEEDYTDLLECAWDNSDYIEGISAIREDCGRLYALCEAAGDKWYTMSFTLKADYSYNIDYSYDNIVNYDSRFILNWQSEYLD